MKKENRFTAGIITVFLVLILIAIISLNTYEKKEKITDFESCVKAGNPVMESYPRQCKTPNGKLFTETIANNNEIDTYFREELWRRGVENLGGAIPIEGFNPELYIGAYPGLIKEDFNKVNAINGHWELQNGELVFIMISNQLITSADGTITEKGISELLENLEKRLGENFNTKENIDNLLDTISREQ